MATAVENEVTRGGQFLVKETKCEDVFTPEDFSDEQIMMRDSVKEFVDKEIWPNKHRFENKDYAFTEECMRKAGELGLLGVAVPVEYGGLGMGFVSTMLVCDYISGATGSFSTAFGAHTGIGTLPFTLYGTEEQKLKYVPKLATGEWFGAYCLTEPGAGSDANSGKTKAVLSDDGTHYKITGQKMWISNAGFCSVFIVFARIEDDKNITGFIVENDASNGISMNEEEHKLGIRASSTRQVFFMLGKFGIGYYLGTSTIATVYGAAGSIIIILIWVYYSAIILYFGAEFTKVYSKAYGKKIIPNAYAVEIRKEVFEIETVDAQS